jgi:hypothetical protein
MIEFGLRTIGFGEPGVILALEIFKFYTAGLGINT